jgi:uncharacterized protein YecT (DUF1311 family)
MQGTDKMRLMATTTLLVIGVTIFGTPAVARCPGDTQMEMNACAAEDYKRADAKLNAAYRRLAKTPELIATERDWIKYRDTTCANETADYRGGSMESMVYSECMAEKTEERIAVLNEMANERR